MKKSIGTKRTFVPTEIAVTWENISALFENLQQREIHNTTALEQWLRDRSELEGMLQEDYGWRYIRMTCDTSDPKLSEDFQYFATEIEPKMAKVLNALDEKLISCGFLSSLDQDKYHIYLRKVKNNLSIFREENIPLFTEIQLKQQEYQSIVGGLTVMIDNNELTMQQASVLLLSPNRELRQSAWMAIAEKRLEHRAELNKIYNELIALRHRVALNAGFENYRDYMFVAMGRFDYTVDDVEKFHASVAETIVPLLKAQAEERRIKLQVDVLKPWDMSVDPDNRPALSPFKDGDELITKTAKAFANIDPYMGECIEKMQQQNLFDVDSRKGKAPGGYNYPLYETGAPFIFMNSTGTMRDLTTMVHEGGHAVHTFITADLALNEFKDLPSEVAELASMSMELVSMDQWGVFFNDSSDLIRAKKEQLEDALSTLPWVATVDKFQHWVYTHPQHSIEEREAAWLQIYREFGHGFSDWSMLEEQEKSLWHKQLHIFEVPFYYIEYGFAQIGALSVWRNYIQNPQKAIQDYLSALRLGYTKSIGEVYETAGVKFDFSQQKIAELADFVNEELQKLSDNG